MSSSLWQRVPAGFLKMKYNTWDRLDYEVKVLIVELATDQKFKCAFCSEERSLIVEHDHEPEQGSGARPTIYNIRGLTCQRCNWHLALYEKDQRGEYRGWDHVDPMINSSEYEGYMYIYECRLSRLHEDYLEKACPNYWSRRLFLDKFDEWKYWGGTYPWYWGFEEIKEKRHGSIRTPKQFLKTLVGIMKFVVEEKKKDPNYHPPDAFFEIMAKIKPLLDHVRAIAEERLKGIERSDLRRKLGDALADT